MSLRPRQDFTGRALIAQQRMAPGGRRWSESPVPRAARRRVRQMGQATTTPPTPPVMTCIGPGSNAYLDGTSSGVGPMTWNAPKAVGDLLVAITAMKGSTCIPPAGWTVAFGGTFTGWDGTYTWNVSYGTATTGSYASEGVFNGGAPAVGVSQGFIMRVTSGTPHPVLVAGPFTSTGTSLTFPTVPTTTAVHPVQHTFAAAASDVTLDAIYSPAVSGSFPVWFQYNSHGLRFEGSGPKGAKVGNPTAGGPYYNVPQSINLQHYFAETPVTCDFVSFVWGWA